MRVVRANRRARLAAGARDADITQLYRTKQARNVTVRVRSKDRPIQERSAA